MTHVWVEQKTKLAGALALHVCSQCGLQRCRGTWGVSLVTRQIHTRYRPASGARWEQVRHVPACGGMQACSACAGMGQVSPEARVKGQTDAQRLGRGVMDIVGRKLNRREIDRVLRFLRSDVGAQKLQAVIEHKEDES